LRIPAYKIHNVLQQYTDKLTGVGGQRAESRNDPADSPDESGFFNTVKRREIIGAIADKIKEKVSRVGSTDLPKLEDGRRPPAMVKNGEFTPFEYNVIDKDHRKVKRTISVTRFYEP